MKVNVKLFQPFSQIVGKSEIIVPLDHGNLETLLNSLSTGFPSMKEQIFDKQGKVRDHLNIFINQVPVTSDKEKTAVLRDGDEVMLMMAVAGG